MEEVIINDDARRSWWAKRRLKYNKGLVIAGALAFIAYCVVGTIFIEPHEEFEVTLFTIAFQGVGYLIMIGVANIFYNLGYALDCMFNRTDSDNYRRRLFNLGYWFSVGLPFLIPVAVLCVFTAKYGW